MFGFFSKVRSGLEATKNRLSSTIKSIFGKNLDPGSLEELEASLYLSDIGVNATQEILSEVQTAHRSDPSLRVQSVKDICKTVLQKILHGADRDPTKIIDPNSAEPTVICLIGTNGSGKTTTTAKLAAYFSKMGHSVIVGACDTFRAAANEQIHVWSERLHFDLVGSQTGADPSAVAFDTCQAGVSRKKDVIILDTAGRLHNKANLLGELQKLKRAIGKVNPKFPQHIWLVADASLGSNTITSAGKFHEELGLTGLIVTKLDGTSRGGALIGIYRELGIPVYFIGIGESQDDLIPFRVEEYVDALLS